MNNSTPSSFRLTLALIVICVGTNGSSITKAYPKRFLFDQGFDCQKCINCACNLTECPNFNILDIAGSWLQCASVVHDADCNVPFHQHGQWSDWGPWTNCQGRTCESTSRSRQRTCTNPEPKNCGEPCDGDATEVDTTCVPSLCQVFAGLLHPNTTLPTSTPTPSTSTSTESTTAPSSSIRSSTTTEPTTLSSSSIRSSTTTEPTTMSSSSVHASTSAASPHTLASVTPPVSVTTSCSKYCAISPVAAKQPVEADHARKCSDNTTGSSEALLMYCCGLSDASLWHSGPNVMLHCDAVPQYTPVASFTSFTNGQIESGSEGIFIGCLAPPETGIKIIRQDCNEAPSITYINLTQTIFPNPYTYFALS